MLPLAHRALRFTLPSAKIMTTARVAVEKTKVYEPAAVVLTTQTLAIFPQGLVSVVCIFGRLSVASGGVFSACCFPAGTA